MKQNKQERILDLVPKRIWSKLGSDGDTLISSLEKIVALTRQESVEEDRGRIVQWALENVFTLTPDPDSMGVVGYEDLLKSLSSKEEL